MNTVERYYNVSQTQLSIARFYGGAKVQGSNYVYDPTTDTLIRDDVFKREQAESKAKEPEISNEKRRVILTPPPPADF